MVMQATAPGSGIQGRRRERRRPWCTPRTSQPIGRVCDRSAQSSCRAGSWPIRWASGDQRRSRPATAPGPRQRVERHSSDARGPYGLLAGHRCAQQKGPARGSERGPRGVVPTLRRDAERGEPIQVVRLVDAIDPASPGAGWVETVRSDAGDDVGVSNEVWTSRVAEAGPATAGVV